MNKFELIFHHQLMGYKYYINQKNTFSRALYIENNNRLLLTYVKNITTCNGTDPSIVYSSMASDGLLIALINFSFGEMGEHTSSYSDCLPNHN